MSSEASMDLNKKRGVDRKINQKSDNSARESLHARLIRLYGEKTSRLVRRFDKLKQRKTKQLSTLAFLQRCRDKKVIPPSLKIKYHHDSPAVDRIIRAASLKLLIQNLHRLRKDLDFTSTELYKLHLRLSSVLNWYDFTIVDDISTLSSDYVAATTKQKYCEDFDQLFAAQHPSKVQDLFIPVINKSSKILDETTMSVISKGLNFMISPRDVPKEEIVCAVETALQKLPKRQANCIRQKTASILKNASKPKTNIPSKERKALFDLRSDKSLIVLAAYKDNSTVIMDTADYKRQVKSLLRSPNYIKVTGNPIAKTERKINSEIKNSAMSTADKKELKRTDTQSPRMYALPKIENGNITLVPKIGTLGSVYHSLTKYIADKLKPHSYGPSALKTIGDFMNVVKYIKLNKNSTMATFVMTSPLNNTPAEETLSIIEEIINISSNDFSEDFYYLIETCFESLFFVFGQKYYKQVKGFALEDDVCRVLFNIYMSDLETKLLENLSERPTYWLRHNNNIFVITSKKELLDDILSRLNSYTDNLKFVINVEQNSAVRFEDFLIKKDLIGGLKFSVFDSVKIIARLPYELSYSAPSNKYSILRSIIKNQCDIEDSNSNDTISQLRQTVISKGYSPSIFNKTLNNVLHVRRNYKHSRLLNIQKKSYIKNCDHSTTLPFIKGVTDRISKILLKNKINAKYRSGLKISKCMRTGKDFVDPLAVSGIYRIPCKCNKIYIGQTKRLIKTRLQEHKISVEYEKFNTSALAYHVLSCSSGIDFDRAKTVSRETTKDSRDTRESIEIAKLNNSLNQNNGRVLNPYWKDLFAPPPD